MLHLYFKIVPTSSVTKSWSDRFQYRLRLSKKTGNTVDFSGGSHGRDCKIIWLWKIQTHCAPRQSLISRLCCLINSITVHFQGIKRIMKPRF